MQFSRCPGEKSSCRGAVGLGLAKDQNSVFDLKRGNASLQLILPTDKRNPCFTLYQSEDGRFIHVYYGLELLEVIPGDQDHPAYKMLVARLYNADVKVSAL